VLSFPVGVVIKALGVEGNPMKEGVGEAEEVILFMPLGTEEKDIDRFLSMLDARKRWISLSASAALPEPEGSFMEIFMLEPPLVAFTTLGAQVSEPSKSDANSSETGS